MQNELLKKGTLNLAEVETMAESAITTEDMLPDLPPSSDEDDTESLPNGTRPVCFIGISENDICDYFSTRGKRLSPEVYNSCVEDVLPHLSSFFPSAAAAGWSKQQ